MKKKILAGLLALCMIFSMVPMSAFAAEETTPTAVPEQVLRAPLHDTRNESDDADAKTAAVADTLLNLDDYKVTVTKNEEWAKEQTKITAVYDVTLAHPAVLEHQNNANPKSIGKWVGIGVKCSVPGTDTQAAANENPGANLSAYCSKIYTTDPEVSTVVSDLDNVQWTPGGWGAVCYRPNFKKGDTTYVSYYLDIENESVKNSKTIIWAERSPASTATDQVKYIIYRIHDVATTVKAGHLVTIEDPTNGTLTVKNGTTEVETGTPVAVGTELTITAEPAKGYKLTAVKVDGTAIQPQNNFYKTTVGDKDITISAEFEAITHTVTFVANGGTGTMENATLTEGEYTLPACTFTAPDGKVFAGWQIGDDTTTVKQAGDKINLTANITLTATWTEKVSTGISVGFEWNGDDANSAINLAVRKADKVYPVSDSIDASYWLLLNEPMTDESKKHAYEIKLGSRLVKEGVFSGGEGKVGIWYDSFQMKKKGNDDTYVDADIPVNPGDTLTFTVYPDETKTGTAITETITIPANPLKIASAEATNIAEKKITVKFNNDLLGRYTIEVKKGDTPVASATTECNRAPDANDAGKIAKETGIELTANEALTAGTYTVTLKPTITGAEDIDTTTFELSDDIATIDVFVGEAETASTIITAKVVVDEADPTKKMIVIEGTVAAPSENITLTLVAKDAEGNTVGALDDLTVTYNSEENKLTIPANSKLTGIYGTEYPVEADLTALTTDVADPVNDVNTDDCDLSEFDQETQDAVVAAVESVAVEETSKSVITDAATIAAKEEVESKYTVTDEIIEQLPDAESAEDVKVVVIPTVKVKLENYTETTGDTANKTLKVDISAKYIVVATTAATTGDIVLEPEAGSGQTVNAIDITAGSEPKSLTISTAIDLSVTLPTGFTDAGTLYVLHKNAHYHKGTVAGNTLTFTSDDGLSPFEINASKTAMGASIGNEYYDTLKDAIAAVKDNETIVLQGNCAENVTVNKAVIFTIDSNGNEFSGEIKAATGFTLKQEGSKYTITKNSGGGSSSNSGGGGSTTTTYPITAPTAEGGKVSVNSSAAAGATVTITTTPDEGKKVDTVTVTDVNGNAIAVTKADTNRYTFVMPSAAVTIKVTFVDGSEEPVDPDWDNPYSDVKEKDWFYDAVKYVTENGLMQGTGKDKFEPDTKLTRGMFAQILYNKAGKPEVTGTVDFTDFESGKWYSDAVVWASKNGVLKGYDDGSVGVNDKITREQLATMLWRYVGEPEASADVTVNGSPSKYAVEAMRWAVGAGVIKGDQNGNHNPRGMASRAEAAQMLTNYYNK